MPFSPLSFQYLSSVLLFSIALFLPFPNPLLHPPTASSFASSAAGGATSFCHLLFGIASSARSWPHRQHYLHLWWCPTIMHGFVFLDSGGGGSGDNPTLPSIRISVDASHFPYSFKGGLPSAVCVAQIAKELVDAIDGRFPMVM